MRLHVMRSFQLASIVVTSLVGLFGSAAVAHADNEFHPVPSLDKNPSGLQARILSYEGTSNGKMTIEVVNRGTSTQTFNDVFHGTINKTGSWFTGTVTGSI